MRIKTVLPLLVILLFCFDTVATRQNTTHSHELAVKNDLIEVEQISTSDSTLHVNPAFDSRAISIMGFDKRVSESREIFFVRNNTQFIITRIKLKLRYNDVNGNMLHQRTEIVECDIPSGETRQLTIPSFDKQRSFYYYLSPKPRKQSTSFKVAFQLLRYDIKIEP